MRRLIESLKIELQNEGLLGDLADKIPGVSKVKAVYHAAKAARQLSPTPFVGRGVVDKLKSAAWSGVTGDTAAAKDKLADAGDRYKSGLSHATQAFGNWYGGSSGGDAAKVGGDMAKKTIGSLVAKKTSSWSKPASNFAGDLAQRATDRAMSAVSSPNGKTIKARGGELAR